MTNISLKTILEAAIFAAAEPLNLDRLQSLFDQETERPSKHELKQALEELINEYAERPIHLKESGSGYTFQVAEEFSPWVGKLWQEKTPRHSRALLETLAIIAYRQPITRAEIEEIRGVSVSTQIVKTLMDHEWVRVVGQREVPGRPSLYATTPFFLDYFNIKNLSELPSLMELQSIHEQQEEAIKEAALGYLPQHEQANENDEDDAIAIAETLIAEEAALEHQHENEAIAEENQLMIEEEIIMEEIDSEESIIDEPAESNHH